MYNTGQIGWCVLACIRVQTVGFGDIVAQTYPERVVSVLGMLAGGTNILPPFKTAVLH